MQKQQTLFCFFKVTEGVSHKDSRFSKYIKQAREKEIRVGAYHFFSYSSSGKNQALHFLKHAQLQKGDLPYVLDAEYKRKMPKQQKVSTEIKAFLETVEKQTGVRPIIYCEQDYYNKYIKNEIEKIILCGYVILDANQHLITAFGKNRTSSNLRV